MTLDDEILQEFLAESRENLDLLDRELVALERDPAGQQRIGGIFRAVHTIKGTAGFLDFKQLESVTHAGENLLSRLRDGRVRFTGRMTTSLLAMCDAVRQILESVEQHGNEGEGDYRSLVDMLNRLHMAPSALPSPNGVRTPLTLPPPPLVPTLDRSSVLHESPPVEQHLELREMQVAETSVRVDVGLLDRLMNLVGELVLARNQILQMVDHRDATFAGTSQRLNLITTELQEGVMKTRMQPIGNVLNKFPRVVRDLAYSCGKQVEIEMEGAETELDRTIIEAVRDPLTHVVRNAIDHGIEMPDVRAAAGKPSIGRLTLRAFHEGGRVNIDLSDDGAGIDPERVKQTAIRRGIISAERAARLTEAEAIALIFKPGFSTAEQVTRLSGRGVGMDVVRTNVEKIGGTVEVHSVLGRGTVLKIKIPLTLAIVPALVIHDNGERYAIPQVSLLELVRLEGAQALAGIETLQGAPIFRLRGNLLPLVYLRTALGGSPRGVTEDDVLNIVVVQADDRPFGLVVDGVSDTGEIVVKPFGREIKDVSVFAGATIMGDGRVALILDVLGVAKRAGIMTASRERMRTDDKAIEASANSRQALLLFQVDDDSRIALPLSKVARLEEFARTRVERAGRRKVVQYRGEILPLIDLCEFFGNGDMQELTESLQVIVYAENGRRFGLVVRRIVDIVDETPDIECDAASPGLFGSTTIQGKVTDLLDVVSVIKALDPALLEKRSAA